MNKDFHRPVISEYANPIEFMRDMITFRKKTERAFSIHAASKSLRRISPTLVSLILQKKRTITIDRVDELSKLLKLNPPEKFYFRTWIERLENKQLEIGVSATTQFRNRKEVSTSILNDWLNVYVKDFFHLSAIQKNPRLLYDQLSHVATPKRIDKSVQFLIQEGHLKKLSDGSIVIDTNLSVADPHVPNEKIRQFHKSALNLAKMGLDLYSSQERIANTLVVQLNQKSYVQLREIIDEFAEKLKMFAAENTTPGERLYQFLINLSPLGRKLP